MRSELNQIYISEPRIARFLAAMGNNVGRSNALYLANIRLAQAIHPLLTQFEVVLRNRLDHQLSSYFDDHDWIINQKSGFMSHPSLRKSYFFLRTCVEKTEKGLLRKRIPITSGKIISDQTFGFWIAFLLGHHYSLIEGQPLHIFRHKPRSEGRSSIYAKLDVIRNFRNRVNHCEPLCFVGTRVDCTSILNTKAAIFQLLKWMEPELLNFFEQFDSLDVEVDNVLRI